MSRKYVAMEDIDNEMWEDEESEYEAEVINNNDYVSDDDVEVIFNSAEIVEIPRKKSIPQFQKLPTPKSTPTEERRSMTPLTRGILKSSKSTPIIERIKEENEIEEKKTEPVKKFTWGTLPKVEIKKEEEKKEEEKVEKKETPILLCDEKEITSILPHLAAVTVDNVSEFPYVKKRPSLEKTKMCNNVKDGGKCERVYCTFAHTKEELRIPECMYADRCRVRNNKNRPCLFIHPGETRDEYEFRVNGVPLPEPKIEPKKEVPPPEITSPEIFPAINPAPLLPPKNVWKEIKKEIEESLPTPPPVQKDKNPENDPEFVSISCSLEMSFKVLEALAGAGIKNFKITIN